MRCILTNRPIGMTSFLLVPIVPQTIGLTNRIRLCILDMYIHICSRTNQKRANSYYERFSFYQPTTQNNFTLTKQKRASSYYEYSSCYKPTKQNNFARQSVIRDKEFHSGQEYLGDKHLRLSCVAFCIFLFVKDRLDVISS